MPYVARPTVRGHVLLSVREKEFVEAAMAQGASNLRLILRSEMLPNVITVRDRACSSRLMIATTMLTEAALSFLSIGVQPPAASWGTIIGDGQRAALHLPVGWRSRPAS